MSENQKHFFVSTLIIAISSFLSRVLGMARQTLLSSIFGATSGQGYTDCLTAAFKLPDIIFNIIIFGTISMVLIPYFSVFIKKEDHENFKKACSGFLNFFFIIISIFIIIGFFAAPFFVKYFLLNGWTNPENINLTIRMTRILLLQVLFMTLSGIFGSYLNSLERYRAYSFAILSYNMGIILGILILTPFIGIEGATWGAVLGSFMHFSIQLTGSVLNGFKYSFVFPKLSPEIKKLVFVAVPRIIAISGEQLIRFFITNISSYLIIGSIFIFDNVENFGMAPFGMIAISISTTVFPIFSKLFIDNNYDSLMNTLFDKIRNLMFLMMPVTALMVVCRNQMIDLVLTYKMYSNYDANLTGNALWMYMIGIPFFSVSVILIRFYFAQKKSIIPMIVSLFSVAVTIIGCYVFSKFLDVSGLSLGRSLGYIVQMLLLIVFLVLLNKKEKKFKVFPLKTAYQIIKIIIISFAILITGILLENASEVLPKTKIYSIVELFSIGGSLTLVYFIICLLVKIPEAIAIMEKIMNIKNKIFKK